MDNKRGKDTSVNVKKGQQVIREEMVKVLSLLKNVSTPLSKYFRNTDYSNHRVQQN